MHDEEEKICMITSYPFVPFLGTKISISFSVSTKWPMDRIRCVTASANSERPAEPSSPDGVDKHKR